MTFLLAFYAFAIGAVVGSFLNVVIHRYPREESIVFPPSHCPNCNTNIRWFDNIPIVSYLVLGARCRNCRVPISPRYPLIELANGLFYLAVFQRTGAEFAFIPIAAIVSMTIVLIFIDLEIQILPDVIDLPGIAIGVAIGAFRFGERYPEFTLAESWLESLIGAAMGALVLFGIAFAYQLIRRVEGMGLGDVKMLAMIGAIVGWRALFPVLMIASISGAAVGLLVAARSRRGMQAAIPFGIFLGLGLLVVIFFGPTLLRWYLALLLR